MRRRERAEHSLAILVRVISPAWSNVGASGKQPASEKTP
jgi:hypothetical protein